ncbi:SMP-30/gluconolactonase/LRE family protein [Diaphorobacter aerolatus]|uniref:SMP-30/gluconolactonase/LRE family protein n=1 Tax=Diaphorobacter aerolatus TaxID=1288495 RepID=A0A7H0GFV8_9BURK|nr:SMP-30/gluconolactonase/LRE family protein [Diaphorobacter aerolatus]QNP47174.1 SMP-30/gluconolactonase/LRE family protein [Diaphorobacter aerolatus]
MNHIPPDAASAWQSLPHSTSQLGESPFWHPEENRLYWVDIAGRALLRCRPDGGETQRWPMPSEPGCIAPARIDGKASGLVIALRHEIHHASAWGGELRHVATLPIDPQTQRANDGKCDALGRFWVGTMHEPASGPRQPVAALFCVDLRTRGAPQVRRVLDGVATANGLAWSPDGSTLYWADTPAHLIRSWDCNAAHEPVGEPRVFRQFAPKPDGWKPGAGGYGGRPDGAAMDAEGNYWCAMYEGARVLCLSPGGELRAELPVPVQCPTMPCFGGAEGNRLFVTSVIGGRPAEEIARMPRSGEVLSHASVTNDSTIVRGLCVQWCELAA